MTHRPDPTVNSTPRRWYHRNWLIIALLIVLPIIGVPLTWTARWSSATKVAGSMLGSLWLLLLISSTTSETSRLDCPAAECGPVAVRQAE